MKENKPKKEKESAIQTRTLGFLQSIDTLPCNFQNQGTVDPKGFRRKFNSSSKRLGISDLFFFIGGKVVFCEVKTPEKYRYIMKHWDTLLSYEPPPKIKGQKKKSDDKERYRNQIIFIEETNTRGQIGFFADSIAKLCEELLKAVEQERLQLSASEIDTLTVYSKSRL